MTDPPVRFSSKTSELIFGSLNWEPILSDSVPYLEIDHSYQWQWLAVTEDDDCQLAYSRLVAKEVEKKEKVCHAVMARSRHHHLSPPSPRTESASRDHRDGGHRGPQPQLEVARAWYDYNNLIDLRCELFEFDYNMIWIEYMRLMLY